jgi:hypothetical protein
MNVSMTCYSSDCSSDCTPQRGLIRHSPGERRKARRSPQGRAGWVTLQNTHQATERIHGHLAGLYRYLGAVNTIFFHCERSAQQGSRLPEHRNAGLLHHHRALEPTSYSFINPEY